MKDIKTTFKDNYKILNLKKNSVKLLSKKFEKIFLEVKSDVCNNKKTLNVLNKNFEYNFNLKDLNQFKSFKTIALIGMGGSILGAEAIYNYFQNKIKKKYFFLIILMNKNFLLSKKNKNYQKFFLLSYQNQVILLRLLQIHLH